MHVPVFHLLLSGARRGRQRVVEAAVGRAAWRLVDDRGVSDYQEHNRDRH